MRGNRRLPAILFHTLFVLCALALIAALVFSGAQLVAILAVVLAIVLFFLPPLPARRPVPVYARRFPRRSFPRAPPRF